MEFSGKSQEKVFRKFHIILFLLPKEIWQSSGCLEWQRRKIPYSSDLSKMFGIRHLPIRANQSQRIWKIQYRRFPLCIKDSQRPDRHFTKIRFDTKSFTFDWEHFFLFWTWHQHILGIHVGKLNNASPMRIFNELLSFCQSSINQVLAKKKLPRWSLFQLVLWWQRYDTTMKNNKQQQCYFQRSWEKLSKWPTQFEEIFSPFFCLLEEILNPKGKWTKNSQKILAPFIPVKMAHWEKGC